MNKHKKITVKIAISLLFAGAVSLLFLHAAQTNQLMFSGEDTSWPIFVSWYIIGIIVALWIPFPSKSGKHKILRYVLFGVILFILIFGGMLGFAIIGNMLNK